MRNETYKPGTLRRIAPVSPKTRPAQNGFSRIVDSILALPLRFKITIPYLVLALLLAGLASWLVSQSLAETLQSTFNAQLQDRYAVVGDAMFQFEANQLAAVRSIARTAGVPLAVTRGDLGQLDLLIRPIAVNSRLALVRVLDKQGGLLYAYQDDTLPDTAPENFTAWDPVLRVLSGESDALGDKYVSVAEASLGATLYTMGPVKAGEQIVGVVLVGTPVMPLIDGVKTSSQANISLFRPNGQLSATTLGGQSPPALAANAAATVAAGGANRLTSRIFTLGSVQYGEALGPLVLRGEPTGWILGVSMPRATASTTDQMGAVYLAVWFAIGVLAVIGLGVVVAQLIAVPVFDLVRASAEVARGRFEVQVKPRAQDELGLLGRRFNQMVKNLRQREAVNDLFGRVVSEQVREALVQGKIGLGGEVKVVTVLFSDIRDFTSFSELYTPQEVVALLNDYFAVVTTVVREAGGLVNKFGGDSMLAVFGAPVDAPPSETAWKAIRAALTIRTRLAELNASRVRRGQQPIRTGIGINTGEVVTGNIGSEERFEYTVVGDTVNIASRIQSLSSEVSESNILITDAAMEALDPSIDLAVVDYGEITLKGRQGLVRVHGVLGTNVIGERRWLGKVNRRQILDALYLYCLGYAPSVIATVTGAKPEEVLSWIGLAADRFDFAANELRVEFGLKDDQLRGLMRTA